MGGDEAAPDEFRPEIRISDHDREQVVELLRAHTAEGRLTLDEFSDRVGQAYAARTQRDLDALTSDLPVPRPPTPPVPAPGPRPPVLSPDRTPVPASRTRWVVAVMSGSNRRGRWDPGDRVNAFAWMGACILDFRDAEIAGAEVVVTAVAFMGGIEIVVPEGMRVEFSGVPFMGGTECKVPPASGDGPVLRVKAFAFMGGIEVKSKPQREHRPLPRGDRAPRPRRPAPGSPPAPRPPSPASPAAASPPAPAGSANGRRPGGVAGGTVTILFTDIEDFTGITERVGDDQAHRLIVEHADLVRREISDCEGLEVSTSGNGFMVAFSSARQAVRCAVAIQRSFTRRNASSGEALRVRMGLHSGDAVHDAEDFFGMAVNVASRIAAQAHGGEILVSGVTRQLAGNMGEVRFEEPRTVQLRGVSDEQQVHRVDWAGADTTS